MFGSVPLRTYLPDGDIDMSIFTEDGSLKDTWTSKLQAKLEEEGKNPNAVCRISDVQVINAEVRREPCVSPAATCAPHAGLMSKPTRAQA